MSNLRSIAPPVMNTRKGTQNVENGVVKIRSFRYASPCLWNQLPLSLRQPHSCTSSSISDSPITSSSSDLPLCLSITPSLFHPRLKAYLFHKFYPLWFYFFLQDCLHGLLLRPFLLSYTVFVFNISLYFSFWVPCAGLSWPSRQLLSGRKYTVLYHIVLGVTQDHWK